jgi:hypothetical protein
VRGLSPLARLLVVLLAVAIGCAAFSPPATCEHDCCGHHSGDCAPGDGTPALACVQSPTLAASAPLKEASRTVAITTVARGTAEPAVIRTFVLAEHSRDAVYTLGARSSPLRI